jgi:probable rRNA maturation factor
VNDAASSLGSIDVIVNCDRWLQQCPDAAVLATAAARAALEETTSGVVGVVLTDDTEQRQLNRTYRSKDAPTNVLAFPLGEAAPHGAPLLLGDIVLAYETVAREAADQRKPLADHLRHLVVHGVLHLLGFDHETDTDAALMEAREIEILARLGVPDPYCDTM